MSSLTQPHKIRVVTKIKDSGSTLAQATVIIDEAIEIHGWRVSKSQHLHDKFQEDIWIQPPAFNTGGKWKSLVFINDKSLFDEVEEKIYDSYSMKKNQLSDSNKIEMPPEVDPEKVAEEIPF